MLNFAENSSLNGKKIFIIHNSRDDYLNALRRLTRKGDPSVLIRAMERARLFSSKIIGDNFEESRTFLDHSNAFKDGDGYILVF